MRIPLLALAAAAPLVCSACDEAQPTPPNARNESPPLRAQATPTAFIPNRGQWNHEARFVARFETMNVFLNDDGWSFTLGRARNHAAVRMRIEDALEPELVPDRQLPGVHHYKLGSDPQHWRTNVPRYGSVRYFDIRPGVDLVAREHDRHFEYDLILQPDASVDDIVVAVEGADGLRIDDDGALLIDTAVGPVRMPPPPSWEAATDGTTRTISCGYAILDTNRFGFTAPTRQPGWDLVIDPGLIWSTFLGSTDDDLIKAVATTSNGDVVVAGESFSAAFPTSAGAFDTSYNGGSRDGFVSRLSGDGSSLIWSTFFGGDDRDHPVDIALDAADNITLVGSTASTDFPTTSGAYDTTHSGVPDDAFVIRLSASGSTLLYSTFLGGNGNEYAEAVALDPSGSVTITGGSTSPDFPATPGAFDTTPNGNIDAFVARFTPAGDALVYATLLGGSWREFARDIAVDDAGVATVIGFTLSPDFPVTQGALDTTYGSNDAFVTRISADGSSLVWSTYLGDRTGIEIGWSVAVDDQGRAIVGGSSFSAGPTNLFPTTAGAFDTTFNGLNDAFLARISSNGASLEFSTLLGGAERESIQSIAIDSRGAVTFVGQSQSPGWPTTEGAYDRTHAGEHDVVVGRLSPDGTKLEYSTFVGGGPNTFDYGEAMAVDARGVVTVAGFTQSPNFPVTPGAYDQTYGGGIGFGDAFVARVELLPSGVSSYGASSPGCDGELSASVNAIPSVGNTEFRVLCNNAPPNRVGGLLVGSARFASPPTLLGVEVLVDPSAPLFVIGSVLSRPNGGAEFRLPLQQNPSLLGFRFFTQFLWIGPAGPAPCPPSRLSASHGLDITVQ